MTIRTEKIKLAHKYHAKGLNSKEIAKLLDCSYRTIQGYISANNWNKHRPPTNIKVLAVTLLNKGFSRNQVARRLNVSISTVDNYRRAILSPAKK